MRIWTSKNTYEKAHISFRNIALIVYTQSFFDKILYVTVYSVRIWTYKNTDEKTHTFSRISKNGRKTDTA